MIKIVRLEEGITWEGPEYVIEYDPFGPDPEVGRRLCGRETNRLLFHGYKTAEEARQFLLEEVESAFKRAKDAEGWIPMDIKALHEAGALEGALKVAKKNP